MSVGGGVSYRVETYSRHDSNSVAETKDFLVTRIVVLPLRHGASFETTVYGGSFSMFLLEWDPGRSGS